MPDVLAHHAAIGAVMGKFELEESPYAEIIALDPGGTTGWCVMAVEPAALADPAVMILDSIFHWSQGQFYGDDNEQTDQIADLLDAWPSAPLLMERFILRKFLQSEELLSPVRISARAEYLAARGGYGRKKLYPPRPFIYQNVDAAKKTATDERLKEWGLYLADGNQHARDATRHAITLMRNAKEQRTHKLKRYLWPQFYAPGSAFGPVVRGRSSGTGVRQR